MRERPSISPEVIGQALPGKGAFGWGAGVHDNKVDSDHSFHVHPRHEGLTHLARTVHPAPSQIAIAVLAVTCRGKSATLLAAHR